MDDKPVDPFDAAFCRELESQPLEELRRRRALADERETGYSYLRRLVQGRLDIVVDERERRSNGAGPGTVTLVDRLPEILGGGIHAPGRGRLPQHLEPGELDPLVERRLDEIISTGELADPPAIEDSRLRAVTEALYELERQISTTRRALQEVVDAISAEVVRRYRDGEVPPDTLPLV
ncbi:MAG: RsiG family protein [Acidimicrobiales bacterium]